MDDAQKVKDAIDIVQFIGKFIQLKKAGRNFLGLCPFHGEKTPSFNVSPEKQIFKCFGCGVSGDVISFTMQREGLSFTEALNLLANEAGITLAPHHAHDSSQEDRLFELLEQASKIYHHLLIRHPSADQARNYLKKRGFDLSDPNIREIAEQFQLGYAPNTWRTMLNALISKKFKEADLLAAGIITSKNGRSYDMFRNRLIFPLYNRVGKIVGFSGRVLDDTKPKYINTMETPVFHKREFLYGFYHAREHIRKSGSIIIVEGEMDMLSSWKIGVKNVSAVKGSSLTPEHLKNIKHLATTIKLNFDADNAGTGAQIKAIQDGINEGFQIEIISVPQGKDADETIRENPQAWITATQNTKPFYDFLIDTKAKQINTDRPEAKADLLNQLKPHLTQIKDPTIRAHYINRIAHLTLLSVDEVRKLLENNIKAISKGDKILDNISDVETFTPDSEHYLVALLLQDPLASRIAIEILPVDALHDTKLRLLYNQLAQYKGISEEQPIEELLARTLQSGGYPPQLLDSLYSMATPAETELLHREVRVTSLHLARQWLHLALNKVSIELKKAQVLNDNELINKLQNSYFKLTQYRQTLEAYAK